jgi:hypothetical protein
MKGWATTPMNQEDSRRQQQQDLLDNALVNSKEAKSRKLTRILTVVSTLAKLADKCAGWLKLVQ